MSALPPVIFACVMLYFAYHATVGANGLAALVELGERREIVGKELAEVKARNLELVSHVSRLKPGSLDLDFLEERSRLAQNAVTPDEWMVLVPDVAAQRASDAS
jgi:cell division protein FtsB